MEGPVPGRFHLGVLRFTPSLVITDVGVDNNVFNETIDPKQDTTAGVGPAVAWWMNAGRARISASNGAQYLYFKKYSDQRGWNTANTMRIDLLAGRLTPFAFGSYTNTRNRTGYEIDSRSRAATSVAGAGAEIRISGKTRLTISGQAATTAFDTSESFLGASLAQQLNERARTETVTLRYTLTPLTTFVVKADGIQDRFNFAESRDADSIRVMPGFEFKPFALISGQVMVGYRRFNVFRDTIPDFQGAVAAVQAAYVLRATRFEGIVNRDVAYSVDALRPYYALTDAALTITQKITTTWDVRVRGARQLLAYRSMTQDPPPLLLSPTPAPVQATALTDRGVQYSAGLGYQLGTTARIGLDATYSTRRSNIDNRTFEGFRAGASVSYGLQP